MNRVCNGTKGEFGWEWGGQHLPVSNPLFHRISQYDLAVRHRLVGTDCGVNQRLLRVDSSKFYHLCYKSAVVRWRKSPRCRPMQMFDTKTVRQHFLGMKPRHDLAVSSANAAYYCRFVRSRLPILALAWLPKAAELVGYGCSSYMLS